MKTLGLIFLLIANTVAALAVELPVQVPEPESNARRRLNQVFVKVIVPVTSRTPKQDGPFVESWVAEQLKSLGEGEYFAVTDWVPVCDGLHEDDIVDNDVWDGRLSGKHSYCPVAGDIPRRENGRVSVSVAGWLPFGVEAKFRLPDEPGIRTVKPVQNLVGEEQKLVKTEDRLPYVAVLIAPPPHKSTTSHQDAD